ncbi:uncharacterized protein LOC135847809 [Planococcus citri]|uniref:uncharacterized protein LOC135831698 n=1 Tax=Planococcus citri TaxID=170843 RepID=UPI0031F9F1A8
MASAFGTMYMVAWAVMRRRNTICYVEVFRALQRVVQNMLPRIVITDFELALQRAVRIVWPLAQLLGCYFHYVQALRRNRAAHGLTTAIVQANPVLRRIYEMATALPLLPADDIPLGFSILREYVRESQSPEAQSFYQYLRAYWFPRRALLSVYGQPRRTNNEMEALNRRLPEQMTVRQHRPSYDTFLNGMMEVSNAQYGRYLRAGQAQQVRWPADRRQEAHERDLTRAWDEYDRGVRTAEEVLRFLGHHAPDVAAPEADAARDNAREREEDPVAAVDGHDVIEVINIELDWDDEPVIRQFADDDADIPPPPALPLLHGGNPPPGGDGDNADAQGDAGQVRGGARGARGGNRRARGARGARGGGARGARGGGARGARGGGARGARGGGAEQARGGGARGARGARGGGAEQARGGGARGARGARGGGAEQARGGGGARRPRGSRAGRARGRAGHLPSPFNFIDDRLNEQQVDDPDSDEDLFLVHVEEVDDSDSDQDLVHEIAAPVQQIIVQADVHNQPQPENEPALQQNQIIVPALQQDQIIIVQADVHNQPQPENEPALQQNQIIVPALQQDQIIIVQADVHNQPQPENEPALQQNQIIVPEEEAMGDAEPDQAVHELNRIIGGEPNNQQIQRIDGLCYLCFEREPNAAAFPCGHMGCEPCLRRTRAIRGANNACPQCRARMMCIAEIRRNAAGQRHCMICHVRWATFAGAPCGHQVFCDVCSDNTVTAGGQCPVCHRDVVFVAEIHWPRTTA